jgi:flagellar basal-body rod protein FlgB
MEPIYLLDLASRKTAWLSARQSVVATNVANSNTPGFRPKDVAPFQDVLAHTQLSLVSTSANDIAPPDANGFETKETVDQVDNFDVTESGNAVGVEDEMTKAGDINREFSLTTSIVKSFHAMLMASVKA